MVTLAGHSYFPWLITLQMFTRHYRAMNDQSCNSTFGAKDQKNRKLFDLWLNTEAECWNFLKIVIHLWYLQFSSSLLPIHFWWSPKNFKKFNPSSNLRWTYWGLKKWLCIKIFTWFYLKSIFFLSFRTRLFKTKPNFSLEITSG